MKRQLLAMTSAIGVALACTGWAQAQDASGDDALRRAIQADYANHLEALYQHFHAHPELSHQEVETAARLAAELRALGFEVTEQVGGTGVVAVMENGEGPTLMLRADMDGLPVREQTGLSYAHRYRRGPSRRREPHHACLRPRYPHDRSGRCGPPAGRAHR